MAGWAFPAFASRAASWLIIGDLVWSAIREHETVNKKARAYAPGLLAELFSRLYWDEIRPPAVYDPSFTGVVAVAGVPTGLAL